MSMPQIWPPSVNRAEKPKYCEVCGHKKQYHKENQCIHIGCTHHKYYELAE